MKLIPGKIYLRDTRNGNIHQYEDLLSQMAYMNRFAAGEEESPGQGAVAPKPELSAADRAAEFDRAASAKPTAAAPKAPPAPPAPPKAPPAPAAAPKAPPAPAA